MIVYQTLIFERSLSKRTVSISFKPYSLINNGIREKIRCVRFRLSALFENKGYMNDLIFTLFHKQNNISSTYEHQHQPTSLPD